ncbi:MAG TPA: hypothetical protein VJ890_29115, partial [Vineibacter sp.]|nr:hypothetical protein [Vineibacter sp.]
EKFFGRVSVGRLEEGVFEVPGGYRPARFKDGADQPMDERNQIIAAFRIAASAARSASDRYRAARDMAASRTYAAAAESLANQMD